MCVYDVIEIKVKLNAQPVDICCVLILPKRIYFDANFQLYSMA